jgi:hypothetical protein
MAAFQTKRAYQIHDVIRRLGQRIINSHRSDITADELFELYTKPGDREVLTRVFKIVQLDRSMSHISHPVAVEGGSVTLGITIDFEKVQQKWLIPRYAKNGPVEGANPEILAKLNKWVAKRIALGIECALVRAVFDELNWRCTAPGLKFFMPSILDILDMIEDSPQAAEQREKLSTAKVPSLPSLPLGMDGVLPQIRATVARGRLMDKKSEASPEGVVRFTVSQSSKGVETPWGTSLSFF